MAFIALERIVDTRQSEILVKVIGGFPTPFHMASRAIRTKFSFVGVLMACCAVFCFEFMKDEIRFLLGRFFSEPVLGGKMAFDAF